jgi:hypothetical protein
VHTAAFPARSIDLFHLSFFISFANISPSLPLFLSLKEEPRSMFHLTVALLYICPNIRGVIPSHLSSFPCFLFDTPRSLEVASSAIVYSALGQKLCVLVIFRLLVLPTLSPCLFLILSCICMHTNRCSKRTILGVSTLCSSICLCCVVHWYVMSSLRCAVISQSTLELALVSFLSSRLYFPVLHCFRRGSQNVHEAASPSP